MPHKNHSIEPGYQVDLKVVQQDTIFVATATIVFRFGGEDHKVQRKGKGHSRKNAELAACKMVLKSMDNTK